MDRVPSTEPQLLPSTITTTESVVSGRIESRAADTEAAKSDIERRDKEAGNALNGENRRKRKLDDKETGSDGNEVSFLRPRTTQRQESHGDVIAMSKQAPVVQEEERFSTARGTSPTQFIQRFEDINVRRKGVQQMRIHVREDRQVMKFARRKFPKVAADLLGLLKDEGAAEAVLESLTNSLAELEQKEIAYDNLEGELIPAEYQLQESEEDLYHHLTGTPFPDQLGWDADITMPHHTAGVIWDQQQLEENLARLDAEHEDLMADSARRAEVGAVLDEYAQDLLDSHPRRRGQILMELAALETQHAPDTATVPGTDKAFAGIGSRFDEVDCQPFLAQILEVKPGQFMFRAIMDENGGFDTGTTLNLEGEDFRARSDVLKPFSNRLFEFNLDDYFPEITFGGYDLGDDFWFEFVCSWLLQCYEPPGFSLDSSHVLHFLSNSTASYKMQRRPFSSRQRSVRALRLSYSMDSFNAILPPIDKEDV